MAVGERCIDDKKYETMWYRSAHLVLQYCELYKRQEVADAETRSNITRTLRVDLHDPIAVFERLCNALTNSPFESYLNEVLRHLLLIAEDSSLGAVAWPYVLNLVHAAATMTTHDEFKEVS